MPKFSNICRLLNLTNKLVKYFLNIFNKLVKSLDDTARNPKNQVFCFLGDGPSEGIELEKYLVFWYFDDGENKIFMTVTCCS